MPRRNNPPGPSPGWLGVSLIRQFAKNPLQFTTQAVRDYGGIVHLPMRIVQAYLVAEPAAVHDVLVTKHHHYRKEIRTKRAVQKMAGNGIIASEGEFWLRQRRIVQQGFAPQRFAHYANVIGNLTRQMLDAWPDNGVIDISAEMTSLALQIIVKSMFNVDMNREAPKLAEHTAVLSEAVVKELASVLQTPDWWPSAGKRRKAKARKALDTMLSEIIRRRSAKGATGDDMLATLLTVADTEGDGSRMTQRQVRDELLTLFHVGYDSSAAGLAWTWYLLAQHPQIAQQAADEADAILSDRPVRIEDFERLPFAQQVVLEALRIFPPAWMLMPRQAIQNTQLQGYDIRRGGWVYLIPWVTHRSERWFPDPLRFDPTRFAPAAKPQIPAYAYFPFGLGPHRCIGERLALVEMTLVMSAVLREFRFILAPQQGAVEVELHTAIRPKGGLPRRVAGRVRRGDRGTRAIQVAPRRCLR